MRSECDEQKETPVPPTIEHITCHHHEGVLQMQLPLRLVDEAVKHNPIEQEDYWQEYRELDGVESIYNPKSFFTRKANISAPMEFKWEQL